MRYITMYRNSQSEFPFLWDETLSFLKKGFVENRLHAQKAILLRSLDDEN